MKRSKDEKRGASGGFRGAVRHGARHFDGTNQPATIWFPDESGLEEAVFRELAESGSSMLALRRRRSMRQMNV
ncbi:MAG: hypothetical protein ACLR3S_10550 [Clostridium fessum]